MPRRLAVHLTAMAAMVGLVAFVTMSVWAALSPLARVLVVGLHGGYVILWLFLILRVTVTGLPDERARERWRRDGQIISWGAIVVIVGGSWLLGPHVGETLRLVVVIYQTGAVTIQVMASIRSPPEHGRPGPEPLIIPASQALFYLVHWERFSPAIILFAAAYGYIALTLRDILQRAVDRTDAALRTTEGALAQAAAERDAKTRFLASASHDLGQPLQAARLFFDQVLRAPDAARRDAAARKVTWAFDATEQLLRQMLDHLKLESGAVQPDIGPLPLGPVIARVAEMAEPAARLAGVEIVAMPSRLAAIADAALVQRALANFLDNAIRHAKARRVLVGARRAGGRVRLWVIDDGVGVAAGDRATLFEDFAQGSDHGDEIRGGFGLGLASARRMAGLMDGKVGLDGRRFPGSAFWLELPLAPAKAG